MKKLSELVTITGGQIITRVIADEAKGDEVVERERRTIVARTISEGCINPEGVVLNNYKVASDFKKVTHVGDIVMKLSAPYNACLIEPGDEEMLVSSFCSILRDVKGVDKRYLVAFLNSDVCQKQLANRVSGSIMSILSNGKLGEVEVPTPDMATQKAIGDFFEKTMKNRALLKKIIKLEDEKLTSMIAEAEDQK